MSLTGSQIIIKLLEQQGIKMVAGIPGGSILPFYNELAKSSIKHILVRHEQSAGFIAQGIARSTGLPAVCIATSGPGAMNLLTAIADARSDSIPMVAITGQVNSVLIGTDAFQEADTFGLSFPITKHSVMIKKIEDLWTAIPEAFEIASSGRPGPVLIDVPRDIQSAVYEANAIPEINGKGRKLYVQKFLTPKSEWNEKIKCFCGVLKFAKKPVLYVGGGVNSFEGANAVAKLLECFPMPIVSSLMGIGVVARSKKSFLGMIGMHGSLAANKIMYESDVVLAVGTHFDDRAIGLAKEFCPNAKILHIDIDAAEINKIYSVTCSIVGNASEILPILTEKFLGETNAIGSEDADCVANEARKNWLSYAIDLLEKTESVLTGSAKTKYVNPRKFIKEIPLMAEKVGVSAEDIIVTTDVGQHQMWAAQYYPVERPRTFLTSGSLGTMGFGLPCAIGAALANPKKRVVCFSGDGSILMNIQELATLSELNLPVTVIVFQNGTLGMVRQQQKYLFERNFSASIFTKVPDFITIAKGFGIETVDVDKDDDWYKIAFGKNESSKARFVLVRVSDEEDVLPYVTAGKANIDAIK